MYFKTQIMKLFKPRILVYWGLVKNYKRTTCVEFIQNMHSNYAIMTLISNNNENINKI